MQMDVSDKELYRRLSGSKKAAQAAFSQLYDRYEARIYTYCYRILDDKTKAEDILQEVFVRFYESVRAGREVANVSSYLFRIARNQCLNEKARKSNANVEFQEEMTSREDQSYDKTEFLNLIEAALETLPDDYNEILVLREIEGCSYDEIAAVTGVQPSVARVRVYRAKRMIRDVLKPFLNDLVV